MAARLSFGTSFLRTRSRFPVRSAEVIARPVIPPGTPEAPNESDLDRVNHVPEDGGHPTGSPSWRRALVAQTKPG